MRYRIPHIANITNKKNQIPKIIPNVLTMGFLESIILCIDGNKSLSSDSDFIVGSRFLLVTSLDFLAFFFLLFSQNSGFKVSTSQPIMTPSTDKPIITIWISAVIGLINIFLLFGVCL